MVRPTTLEQLADRSEIEELLNRYVTAVDDGRFGLLDSVFTSDAHLAYPDAGMEGDYPTVRAWLENARPAMKVWLHLVGSLRVEIDGDSGRAVSTFHFTGVGHDGGVFFTGGEYHDELARTPEGWRLTKRYERNLWNSANAPEVPGA